MPVTNCSRCNSPDGLWDSLCFKCWYQQPPEFMRQARVRASEQTAAIMFKECRSVLIADSIDGQLTCVWFA